jgi:single stranded DNA-binding protein
MLTMNHVQLAGVLDAVPEMRQNAHGGAVLDFRLATTAEIKRAGELVVVANAFQCVAWGRVAELVSKLAVGTPLFVEGRLRSRTWIDAVTREQHAAVEIVTTGGVQVLSREEITR